MVSEVSDKYAHKTFDKYAGTDILIDKPGEICLLSGNEAVARGALEAGVSIATSYPGSPTTYILDSLSYAARKYGFHAEWSTNEKVGFEVALGAAMCGKLAIHITKNVGMNWIMDPLVNQRGWIFPGALVLAIGDDPEANTTSCEQDCRLLAQFAEIPILAPSTTQEVKDYTFEAFRMSEALGCPVMVEMTRVLCYGRSKVVLGPIDHERRQRPASFDHDLHHWSCNVDPEFLGENLGFLRHFWFHQPGGLWSKILKAVEEFKGNELKLNGGRFGVIAAGVPYLSARYAMENLGIENEVAYLKLATAYPLPEEKVRRLLTSVDKVLIIEEIEPVIEMQVRDISAELDSHAEILGKKTGHVKICGSVDGDEATKALIQLMEIKDYEPRYSPDRREVFDTLVREEIVHRPQGYFCPGCPEMAGIYVAKRVAMRLYRGKFISHGDIGCYEHGHSQPWKFDTSVLCMGAGPSLGGGNYHSGVGEKIIVNLGDSTFFHAAIPALINSVYNKCDITYLIYDNRCTASTGHQPHPGAFGVTAMDEPTKIISIEEVAKACLADYVAMVDPYDTTESMKVVEEAYKTPGVSVVVFRQTCAVLAERQLGGKAKAQLKCYAMDTEKCTFLRKVDAFTIDRKEKPPCVFDCPANVNVQGYVTLIRERKYQEALALIKENCPLPGVIGRICHHPCETNCNRGILDEAISVRALKRFVADHAEDKQPPPQIKAKVDKVAIIGSGPAGLTCAYYLAKQGYPVTIFEALPVAGGMLYTGIPEYRLPKRILEAETESIRQLGVEIKVNTPINKDLTLDDLFRQGYKAVFIGVGAHRSEGLGIPGEDCEGVLPGVTFLRELNLGRKVTIGKKTAVIGGGNVAIDSARSALRLGSEVFILYRRSREEMPASDEEIEAAEAEGIKIEYLAAPTEIIAEDGRVKGMRCIRMELGEPDASGRRRPIPIPGSEFSIDVDTVIPAIGQTPDLSFLGDDSGIEITGSGTLKVDSVTLATTRDGIFGGGDVQTGPATAIEAIAAGKEAAISIDRYLKGEDIKAGREVDKGKRVDLSDIPIEREPIPRYKGPTIPLEKRTKSFDEVELGLTEEMAIEEANRCLDCGIPCLHCIQVLGCPAIMKDGDNLYIDQDMCFGCSVCAQVCPSEAIEEVERR